MISCAARTIAFAAPRVERAEREIGFRRGALDDGERLDDRQRHALARRCGNCCASARSARPSSGPPATSIGPNESVSVRVFTSSGSGRAAPLRRRRRCRRVSAHRRLRSRQGIRALLAVGAAPAAAVLRPWSAARGCVRRSLTVRAVSNCKPNCAAGSTKAITASNGTVIRSGTPPNDRPTSKASSSTCEIPELMLQHDGHRACGYCVAHPLRTAGRPAPWC